MSKLIVVSIKPEFANKIFDGSKKIELRKASPNALPGDTLIVYSTFPEMAVIGVCRIQEILKGTPEEVWNQHSEVLGIDKKRFFEYYSGYTNAVGIVLESAKRFKSKIPLKTLKLKIPSFSPPQTFRYYSRDILQVG